MQQIHGRNSSKGMSYLIAGVLVLIAFHAILTIWLTSEIGNYAVLRLWKELVLAACVLPVWWISMRNPGIFKQLVKNRMMQLIAAYIGLQLILGFIAYALGDVSASALYYGLIISTRFLLFFLLCAFVANRTDWLRMHWRTILLIPSVVVILFGLLQFFILPNDFLRYGPETIPVQSLVDTNAEFMRVQSTQRGANSFGAYLVIILTALVVLVATRNHIRRWRILLMVLGSTVLVLTFSRSAWLGMIAAGITGIVLCIKTKRQRDICIAIMIGLLAVVIACTFFFRNTSTFQNIVFHTNGSTEFSHSKDSMHASAAYESFRGVLRNPLGSGAGSTGVASVYNTEGPSRTAENYFLQIGQEVGLLGVLIFSLILIGLGRGWLRERNATLNRVMLASLVGMVLINTLWSAWSDATVAYVWWGLAGIAYGSQIARQQERIAREKVL